MNRGTLEQGKLADIVFLEADPLTDIHNTEAIWRVVKNGRLLPEPCVQVRFGPVIQFETMAT